MKRRRRKLTNFLKTIKLDKGVFSHASLHDQPYERPFWHRQTPQARLQALELMRQINYGYDRCAGRLQRVLEVVKFGDT